MLTGAPKALVKHQNKQVFMKKLCNHYLVKTNILHFQDKIYICRILNQCPEGTS